LVQSSVNPCWRTSLGKSIKIKLAESTEFKIRVQKGLGSNLFVTFDYRRLRLSSVLTESQTYIIFQANVLYLHLRYYTYQSFCMHILGLNRYLYVIMPEFLNINVPIFFAGEKEAFSRK
jgi:hypothetical protein